MSRRGEENHIDAKIDTAAAAKTTELRYTANLRTTFEEWLKIMKNLDVTKFKSPISVCHDELEIYSVSTKMTAGVASGRTEITFKDNNVMQANLHRGVINGLVRKLRCKYGHCDIVLESENESLEEEDEIEATYLGQLSVYTGGQPETSLYGWWFPVGGGALYCTSNENDRAEGDGCVYLYADISTGIVGQWKGGHMVEGRPALLQSFVMSSGLLKPEMKILEDREPYYYFQSTNTTIAHHPMVTDIFEDYHVYISTSTIKDAGEGIFAKTDFEFGDLVAIYNGIRLTEMEHRVSKESRRSPYSIHGWENMILDIPKKYQSLKNYKATSGHKANHSKKPNGEYFLCEHPRFGEIVCVYAKKQIKANEEIFVDYGYIEKYLKTQSAIEGMLKFAKHVGGFEDNETFKQEMKRTLGFFREKIEDIKPYLAAAKMAKNFLKS